MSVLNAAADKILQLVALQGVAPDRSRLLCECLLHPLLDSSRLTCFLQDSNIFGALHELESAWETRSFDPEARRPWDVDLTEPHTSTLPILPVDAIARWWIGHMFTCMRRTILDVGPWGPNALSQKEAADLNALCTPEANYLDRTVFRLRLRDSGAGGPDDRPRDSIWEFTALVCDGDLRMGPAFVALFQLGIVRSSTLYFFLQMDPLPIFCPSIHSYTSK